MAMRMGVQKEGKKADTHCRGAWRFARVYRIRKARACSLKRATPSVILCLNLSDIYTKVFIRYHNAYLGRQRLPDTTQGLRRA